MARPSPSDPLTVVREAVRRWDTGEPPDGLFAADFRSSGQPIPLLEFEGDRVAGRRDLIGEHAAMRTSDDLVLGTDGRVLTEYCWSHDDPNGGGSAGMGWSVFHVRDGLVHRIAFFQDERSARQAAGLPEG